LFKQFDQNISNNNQGIINKASAILNKGTIAKQLSLRKFLLQNSHRTSSLFKRSPEEL
jgi:hypothetical protein